MTTSYWSTVVTMKAMKNLVRHHHRLNQNHDIRSVEHDFVYLIRNRWHNIDEDGDIDHHQLP